MLVGNNEPLNFNDQITEEGTVTNSIQDQDDKSAGKFEIEVQAANITSASNSWYSPSPLGHNSMIGELERALTKYKQCVM